MGQNFSWIKKLVTDLIDKEYDDDEQETSETKTELFALKTVAFPYASRSNAKAKPRRPISIVPIRERIWIDIEPGTDSNIAFPVSKRLTALLRHGQLPREEDGAIEFWRLKDCFRNEFENSQHCPEKCGRARRQEAEATRKEINIVLTRQDKNFFISELFKVIQDTIPLILHCRTMCQFRTIFFEYIYHNGCAINLHSITSSGLIPGGQILGKERQTVFLTAVNPMNKDQKDPQELDLTKPRLASYLQKWKRHHDTVYWVDIQLAQRKGLKFYQTKCNEIILYDTLPAYCISKVVVMKSEENFARRYMCHLDNHRRFLTKIIGCINWIQKSLEAAKIPNESNQHQKPNYQERRDPHVGKSPQRKSRKVLCLITRTSNTQQERRDPYVDQNPQKIAR